MDITQSAALNYKAARASTTPEPAGMALGETVKQTISDFAQTLHEAATTAQASMTGDADPHALVQALAQSELAVETAVTVRNKVVKAYQEILRMPI